MDDAFPRRMSHLLRPYDTGQQQITIAETIELTGAGMRGTRLLTTALVPMNQLSATLKTPSQMGWAMKFGDGYGMRRSRGDDQPFAIVSPTGKAYEALVEQWLEHNLTVMMPQSRLLATYGLHPRLPNDQTVRWDDAERIEYDVVVVQPLAIYHGPDRYSGGEVRLDRRYAQDYSDTRKRALVAVFFEQQSLTGDDDLEALLGRGEYRRFDVPGIAVEIKRTKSFDPEYPLYIAAWGCRLVLKPTGGFPVSEERERPLTWPGIDRPIRNSRDFDLPISMHRVYVRDEVLAKFEDRPEYRVHPDSGAVSYGGRWELGFCHRVGRDYIAYELRKLYEGTPRSVIEHVHGFVVEESVAVAQRNALGSANIGRRAARLIDTYYDMIEAVHEVADVVGVAMSIADVAEPTREEVEYSGWWTFDVFKRLGYFAPQEMTRDAFLRRCDQIFKVVETLREKALRRIVIAIGVPTADLEGLGSLKLLAALLQLATIAGGSGLPIRANASSLVARWDRTVLLESMSPLFALGELRVLADHNVAREAELRMQKALAVFGVDAVRARQGWGLAVDHLYDRLAESLLQIAADLRKGVE
jgi:hypothetical protein